MEKKKTLSPQWQTYKWLKLFSCFVLSVVGDSCYPAAHIMYNVLRIIPNTPFVTLDFLPCSGLFFQEWQFWVSVMDCISENSSCLSTQLSKTLCTAVCGTVSLIGQGDLPIKKRGFSKVAVLSGVPYNCELEKLLKPLKAWVSFFICLKNNFNPV